MAATGYFDSATPISYSTAYTLWGLSLTVAELVLDKILLKLFTFTLLASQLDITEPEVVYRGRP